MSDLEFVGDYRQPHLTARQRALGHDGSSAGDFTFGDFLDIINPLQHIPVVSTLYREITGDEISPHARILGDTLFGGPTGFLSSIASVLYEKVAGEDVGETVLAFFSGEEGNEGEPQFAGGGEAGAPAGGLQEAAPAPLETAWGSADAMPDAAPGVLTGQDALDALFMDLRGNRQHEAGLPLAGPAKESLPLPGRAAEGQAGEPGKSYPLPPRQGRAATPAVMPAASQAPGAAPDGTAGVAHPLIFAQEAADGAVAERMLQALDKYRTMARQGTVENRRADEESRQEDRVLWRGDPSAAAAAGS